jgi:hypothetical protein
MEQGQQQAQSQCEPRECLESLCGKAFDGDKAKAALALGREQSQIEQMLSGEMAVDEDLDMKVHGWAQERGIEL